MVWVYKWPPRFPACGAVVPRCRTNATPHPRTKLCSHGGRTQITRHRIRTQARARNHLTTSVIPCPSEDGSGYSHPRHHPALPQRELSLNTDTYGDRNPFWTKRLVLTDQKNRKQKLDQPMAVIPDFRIFLVANCDNLRMNNAST